MKYELEFFTNSRYKLLRLLWNNQVKIKNNYYISLSQQELADIAHISKLKVNKIISELMEEKYISLYNNKRGKYIITDKGLKVLQIVKSENIQRGKSGNGND